MATSRSICILSMVQAANSVHYMPFFYPFEIIMYRYVILDRIEDNFAQRCAVPTHEAHLQPFLVSYTVCADWSYVRLLKLNYQPGTTSALRKYTRMHSGKMRTARLLTLSRSIRWGGGLPTPPEADHSQRQTFPWMQSPPPPHTSWR